jgi:four helix bundle protein
MNQKISDRTFNFAVKISKYQSFLKEKKCYEVASQLFRSWTSIWANISEAQSGSSKKDFINKMNISLKEDRETLFWLKLLKEWFDESNEELQRECEEIIKILVVIIKNTKKNLECRVQNSENKKK